MSAPRRERAHVVWFKRDLRLADHRPLVMAARAAARDDGALIPLYAVEPDIWRGPDMAMRHWRFIVDCLVELDGELCALGSRLVVRSGRMETIFKQLLDHFDHLTIYAHEETGNHATYDRDRRIRAWARERGVSFIERPQAGVFRGLTDRNGWARRWDAFMAEPVADAPDALPPVPCDILGEDPQTLAPTAAGDITAARQEGGRARGLELLRTFLESRAQTYRRAMSTPLEGEAACSRLSPHLAHGTLSMREAAQAAWATARDLRAGDEKTPREEGLAQGVSSFIGRLHWRDHFTQKLENEPEFEFRNMHPGYDGMREDDPNHPHLRAWAEGRTGLPFLDACMRSLRATGWLNFRMRAMVQAVACHHLWRHWRAPSLVLARLFTDYEPGIHYPQSQMQAGVTGVNTVRVYNPVKQGRDQDPDGVFTARWVPELRGLPPRLRQEPWKASPMELKDAGVRLGVDYPERIVDHELAAREARERVYAVRRGAEFRAVAEAIQAKHGSRKSGIKNRGAGRRPRKPGARKDHRQTSLDLD